ncbi:AAA family ATPase [Nonomuraea sp. NPDC059194]|uniref:AAA family ATPase n=1 Tax=Nonomuraea sp. NPDC059194 TaxID=3346764 RepID=UPI0036D113C5
MRAPTRLIVLRGNSGSGKTTTARALRTAYGRRGLAIVGQDAIRRDLLRERDRPDGVNIGLIDTITRYSLEHGHHVVLEGILTADRYSAMLAGLARDYAGRADFFYLEVPLDETLRRHATRPLSAEVGEELLRESGTSSGTCCPTRTSA